MCFIYFLHDYTDELICLVLLDKELSTKRMVWVSYNIVGNTEDRTELRCNKMISCLGFVALGSGNCY